MLICLNLLPSKTLLCTWASHSHQQCCSEELLGTAMAAATGQGSSPLQFFCPEGVVAASHQVIPSMSSFMFSPQNPNEGDAIIFPTSHINKAEAEVLQSSWGYSQSGWRSWTYARAKITLLLFPIHKACATTTSPKSTVLTLILLLILRLNNSDFIFKLASHVPKATRHLLACLLKHLLPKCWNWRVVSSKQHLNYAHRRR